MIMLNSWSLSGNPEDAKKERTGVLLQTRADRLMAALPHSCAQLGDTFDTQQGGDDNVYE